MKNQEKNTFQRNLLEELTQSGTWELNLEEKTLFWSPGVFKMLGYSPGEFEVTFEKGLEVIHPDDRQNALDHMNDVLVNSKEYYLKKRLIKKDGTFIKVLSKAIWTLHPETGKNVLSGAFQDITHLLETQAKLGDEQVKNKSLIENLDGIFWEADATTFEFSFVSPQVEKITGYTAKEWLGDPQFWKNHIHPEDRDFAINFCHLKTQKQQDHAFDYRFKTRSGKTIWLNDRVKVISVAGKAHKLQGLMVDITREKEISRELNDQIILNNSLIQNLPGALFLFSLDGNLLLWNSHLEHISGFSPEEIQDMSPEHFFHPKFKKAIQKAIKKVGEKKNVEIVLEIYSKTGKSFPVHFSASLIQYHGNPAILGIGQDISELMESKRLSAENFERYQLATKATNDAIWDYDFTQKTTYFGEGFQQLFGYEPADLSLTKLFEIIHPEDKDRVLEDISGFMSKKSNLTNWLIELRIIKKNGEIAYVSCRSFLIRNEEGLIIRTVGSIQDITNQKELEWSLRKLNDQLEHKIHELAISNEELQRFAYVASHDLQEPLRMISSFMELLDLKYGNVLDKKAHQYIHFAKNGAMQMQKIILDLLEHSKIGNTDEKKESFSTDKLLKQIQLYLKKPIRESHATILFQDLPEIYSYKTTVFQIFLNLLSNSIKYSKPDVPPVINISCNESSDFWVFTVEDNGIGIDPEYWEKVFIMFQKINPKGDSDSTGIGLAIVKKAVEFLGGQISLESKLGEGSKFTFTIRKSGS
ncbi:PAS domain-containing protein [Algoriphagus mannitolivorans]|uniref:PAS domain-containing protein n=1 Tax=Algoriphagus mannitolivorans TaxID=226504 RepID=UPI0004177025|nr:PAS domain-containing protein [Algoriphagus mannitolivorans]